ncbi:uncharacterized protein BYT42DRAFT_501778 [Radiomyces spectabilis]|uniref:uncharacterized protein n=1 Tax=Radiomyces spectabilis TaxID=64574 RepID=UPI00221F0DC4|nr:uncharacterized protein BYT42DRAFT_501778 [Radiomyces spectabilis]KAI8371559.1 hypothetical protein BYT42DRAFT_501778 [Radiomyces spectabilis]
MPRHILIGYDRSEISNKAMEWIVSHDILLPTDKITLATVVNDDMTAVEGAFGLEAAAIGPVNWIADDYTQRVTQMETNAASAIEKVADWYNSKVRPRILNGDPAESLTVFAEANNVDMVIVGCRGLGFLKRQFLGSVSDHLTRQLKCSVLIVKPNAPDSV